MGCEFGDAKEAVVPCYRGSGDSSILGKVGGAGLALGFVLVPCSLAVLFSVFLPCFALLAGDFLMGFVCGAGLVL